MAGPRGSSRPVPRDRELAAVCAPERIGEHRWASRATRARWSGTGTLPPCTRHSARHRHTRICPRDTRFRERERLPPGVVRRKPRSVSYGRTAGGSHPRPTPLPRVCACLPRRPGRHGCLRRLDPTVAYSRCCFFGGPHGLVSLIGRPLLGLTSHRRRTAATGSRRRPSAAAACSRRGCLPAALY